MNEITIGDIATAIGGNNGVKAGMECLAGADGRLGAAASTWLKLDGLRNNYIADGYHSRRQGPTDGPFAVGDSRERLALIDRVSDALDRVNGVLAVAGFAISAALAVWLIYSVSTGRI